MMLIKSRKFQTGHLCDDCVCYLLLQIPAGITVLVKQLSKVQKYCYCNSGIIYIPGNAEF